jgi:hypothetical protein
MNLKTYLPIGFLALAIAAIILPKDNDFEWSDNYLLKYRYF